jgi:type IV pilus assembly protein PilV
MRGRGSWGFTLLELMFALAIIAVGLLAMARMQISAIQGNALGGKMSTAVALGQNQMEGFMTQDLEGPGGPFDPSMTLWQDGATATATIDNPTVLGKQYSGYRVQWDIWANDPIDNVARIQIQVWRPGGNRPVTLTSVKRR